MLTILALYYSYSRDAALLLAHYPKAKALADWLIARRATSLAFPADDPTPAVLTGTPRRVRRIARSRNAFPPLVYGAFPGGGREPPRTERARNAPRGLVFGTLRGPAHPMGGYYHPRRHGMIPGLDEGDNFVHVYTTRLHAVDPLSPLSAYQRLFAG